MNFIMNKIRNSLKTVNVDKLTFIYMNNRIFDRSQNIKEKLEFAKININETYLCEMKNKLLQKKILIFSNDENEAFSSKKPASQQLSKNAARIRKT